MRKLLFAFMLLPFTALLGQGKTLYQVALLKHKLGKAQAFDAGWKTHLIKYHNG
jgi:hypothetical protein